MKQVTFIMYLLVIFILSSSISENPQQNFEEESNFNGFGTPTIIGDFGNVCTINDMKFDQSGNLYVTGGNYSSVNPAKYTSGTQMWNGKEWLDIGKGSKITEGRCIEIVKNSDGQQQIFIGDMYEVHHYDGENWTSYFGGYIDGTVEDLIGVGHDYLFAGGHFGQFENARGLMSCRHTSNSIREWKPEIVEDEVKQKSESFQGKQITVMERFSNYENSQHFQNSTTVYAGDWGVYKAGLGKYNRDDKFLINGLPLPEKINSIAFNYKNQNIYIGGGWSSFEGKKNQNLLVYKDDEWTALGSGLTGQTVRDIALNPYNDQLFVGGSFSSIGGITANNLARWDGNQWHELSSPKEGDFSNVFEIEINDQGDVFVAGIINNHHVVVKYPSNDKVVFYYGDDIKSASTLAYPLEIVPNFNLSPPTFIRVLDNAKIKIYAEKFEEGVSYVLYPGLMSYKNYPLTGGEEPTKSTNDDKYGPIGSFNITTYPFNQDPVKLIYYTYTRGYAQFLGAGEHEIREDLITTHYAGGRGEPGTIQEIIIPEGVVVTITSCDGKSKQLSYDGIQKYNMNDLPSFRNNIQSIRVVPYSYRITDINIEKVEESKLANSDFGVTISTENHGDLISTTSVDVEVETGLSSTNIWENTSSFGRTQGSSISLSASASVSGGGIGVEVTTGLELTIEKSIQESIERSFTSGKSQEVSNTYVLSADCNVQCEPQHICYVQAKASRIRIIYDVETTLEKWNTTLDKPIPNTALIIKSQQEVKLALSAECLIKPSEKIPLNSDKMSFKKKHTELHFGFFDDQGTFVTSTKKFFDNKKLSKSVTTYFMGHMISNIYQKVLKQEVIDGKEGKREELKQLIPLYLYKKFDEENRLSKYASLTTSMKADEEAVDKGYESLKVIGYLYRRNNKDSTRKKLVLYWNPDIEQFLLINPDEYNGNISALKEIGIQGYLDEK